MIEFKPLELKDKEIFQKYLGDYSFNTYEYSFLTLYFWRKMCNVEFGIIDESLIIKKTDSRSGTYFMQPIGYKREALGNIISKLKDIRGMEPGFKSLFRDIETPFLNELKELYGGNVKYSEDTNNFDYIYNGQNLISLSGSKYHRKKNHYNQFINSCNYEVRELRDSRVISDCIAFSKAWYENRGDRDEQLEYELESIEDTLTNIELLDIRGIAVYVDGQLAGFTMGERVNRSMAIIHVEKGDLQYNGIYSFINKTFIEKCLNDVEFINRQEDRGIAGMRKAKMAYHPVKLEKKYIVDLL